MLRFKDERDHCVDVKLIVGHDTSVLFSELRLCTSPPKVNLKYIIEERVIHLACAIYKYLWVNELMLFIEPLLFLGKTK